MLKTLIEAYLLATQSDSIADDFCKSFDDHSALVEVDVASIQIGLSEITGAELLSKTALKELSSYQKALNKELKLREEDCF